MKYAVSFFALLLLLITGILFFQFQVYSSRLEEGNDKFTYSQEIEIIYKQNSLDIRQHFTNLSNQAIKIQYPKKAVDPACFNASKTSCDRLTKDALNIKVGSSRSQSISYILPLEGSLKSKRFIQDAFAQLENGDVQYTTVHISTDKKIKGQWVTGLPLIGQQSLSLVNYAMFSGEGQIDELYWQPTGLALQYGKPILSIYSSKPISTQLRDAISKMKFLNKNHIAIVQGKGITPLASSRILFLPELSIRSIERNVILSQVLSKYKLTDHPELLSEFIASYLVQSNFGSKKATLMKQQLDKYFTKDQAEQWKTILNELQGSTVTAKLLDEKLSSIIQGSTSYFQMNASNATVVYPVLLEDGRSVTINDLPHDEVKVVLYDGQTLYSAEPILKTLGYTVTKGVNGYYVNSATRTFRFPENEGFYVFNGRRYNTISKPIVKLGDQYYVEEAWLQRLFLVDLEKSDKVINITAMAN